MYSAVAAERRGGAAPLVAREGQAPNGAGRVPVGEPEPPKLVVWHEFLDQRKEPSLLKPDVCVKQLSRRNDLPRSIVKLAVERTRPVFEWPFGPGPNLATS